jgi:hypothetical protein
VAHPGLVLLLAPLVLVAPLMLLAEAVLTLLRLGPVGWPLTAGLLWAVWWSTRWSWRRSCAWWATTKAPVRPMTTVPVHPTMTAP